jgi:hypothetical protein
MVWPNERDWSDTFVAAIGSGYYIAAGARQFKLITL